MSKENQGWISLNALATMAIDYMLHGKLYLALKNIEQIKEVLNELDPMEISEMAKNSKIHSTIE